MTPEQFVYWLNGFAELNANPPTEAQWRVIRDHLAPVFVKVTPERGVDTVPPGRARSLINIRDGKLC